METHTLRRLPGWRVDARIRSWPVNIRLSLLMFLLYSAPGCLVPLFALRLKELGFTPMQIGWCCATQALGSLLAPLLAGQFADRWFAAEKCLALASLLCAGLLWLLSGLTTPAAVFGTSLLLWMVMAPALTLCTTITFAHLEQPRRDFGRVRMWGTVGWVVPGWLLGFWLADSGWSQSILHWLRPGNPHAELADAMRFAAVLAGAFSVYALTLPHTPPRRTGGAAPLAAIRAMFDRAFIIYALCTFGVCVALPFSTQMTPLLLESLDVPRAWIPRVLTIAQGSEIVSLFLLPAIMGRFGLRGTMTLGLAAAVLTLGSLAMGRPLGLMLAGLGMYGLCITCYLVAGQMYLNQRTPGDVRASAQSLHSVLCGLGLLAGNLLAGQVRTWFESDFRATFAVAAGLSLALLGVFVAGFPRGERRRLETTVEPAAIPPAAS